MSVHDLQNEARHHSALRDELLRRWPDLANDDQTLADTLEGLSSLTEQVAAVARSIDEDKIMLSGIKERSGELKDRYTRIELRLESKKAAILHAMLETGERKFELPTVTLSARANPPSVVISDEALIPDEYKITPDPLPQKIDKITILQILKDGKEVSGAVLSNNSFSLAMRSK